MKSASIPKASLGIVTGPLQSARTGICSTLTPRTLNRRALAVASGVGCVLGLGLAAAGLPWGFEARPSHVAWVERYGSVAPFLGEAETAYFVHDLEPGGARHLFFRAQFALAPCVLQDRARVADIEGSALRTRPVILDFHGKGRLRAAVETLQAAAAREGLTLAVERLPGHLAVVRAEDGRGGESAGT